MVFSIALIHPTARVVPMLSEIAKQVMPGVETINIVDEGIPYLIYDAGGLSGPVVTRICNYARNAEEVGVEAIVLASAMYGDALDAVKASVNVPVVRIDAAMIEKAVQFGSSIGVLASQQFIMDAMLSLIRERAEALGREVTTESRLCEDAGFAFEKNDIEAYDYIVGNEASRLKNNDIIVLADILMHRAVHMISERMHVPVLSSPKIAFEDLAKKLNYFRR